VSACLAPPESRLRGTGHPHHDPVYDRPARSGTARAGPQRPTPSTTLRPPRCGSCGGGRRHQSAWGRSGAVPTARGLAPVPQPHGRCSSARLPPPRRA